MTGAKFEEVFKEQFGRCEEVLINKAKEYATEDRLHNFKVAAVLENVTVKKALAGMLAKHTVSVYDMCRSDKAYSIEMWNEKITDHINYLILLRALIEEDNESG